MEIPKRFKLMGQVITVHDAPRMDFDENASGMAHYRTMRIRLQTHCMEHPLLDSDREKIFLHEVIHHILNVMEEDKLNNNEKFVNMFAGFLHQVLTTMEYDD